jgi:hypothetical protein
MHDAAYAVAYDGPNIEKSRLEDILRRVAEKNSIDFAI